jgi:uncharacterized protein
MRVLRAADYRRMPWKNGGGETIEMMVSPADASFDSFDWRISMAHVGAPGPFSLFPSIDRTLSVIAGNGISLKLGDDQTVRLDRQSAPFSFSGDARVDSMLADGAIDDLNVMTQRSRCRHRVSRHTLTMPTELQREGQTGCLVAFGGDVVVRAQSQSTTLATTDMVIFDAGDPQAFIAAPHSPAELFLIEIWEL